MGIRIKLRRDLSFNFFSVNPILNEGELAYEKDTGRFKLGDGVTPWNSLPYLTIAEANDILNRLKTVDGHDSGLDADFVDGYHASTDKISNSWYNRIPVIDSDGNVNIGSRLEFRPTSDSQDFSGIYSEDYNGLYFVNSRDKYRPIVTCNNDYVEIYVDNVNGNDDLGDGSYNNPYASISRAMRDIGEMNNNKVTIFLRKSPYSYGGIGSYQFVNTHNGSITIIGEMEVLDSGSVSSYNGMVDDPVYGSNVPVFSISDFSKNWTQDQWKNKVIRVYKGSVEFYRIITNNTSNTIYFSKHINVDNTWSYDILDWGTKCSGLYISGTSLSFYFINFSDDPDYYDGMDSYYSSDSYFFLCKFINSYIYSYGWSNVTLLSCYIYFDNYYPFSNRYITSDHYSNIFISHSTIDLGNNGFISSDYYSSLSIYNGTRIYSNSSSPPIHVRYFSALDSYKYMDKNVIDISNSSYAINSLSGYIDSNIHDDVYVTNNAGYVSPGVIPPYILTSTCIDGNLIVGRKPDEPIEFTSYFVSKGSISLPVLEVDSDVTLDNRHYFVAVSASNGQRYVYLPPASSCKGRQYIIKKVDSSSYPVSIVPYGTETIDGSSLISIVSYNRFVGIISSGSSWYICIRY